MKTTILAALIATASPAIADQPLPPLPYLGMGRTPCFAYPADWLGVQAVEQWALGYLSAIDADVFSINKAAPRDRLQQEGLVKEQLSQFMVGFCDNAANTNRPIGEAMRAIQLAHGINKDAALVDRDNVAQ